MTQQIEEFSIGLDEKKEWIEEGTPAYTELTDITFKPTGVQLNGIKGLKVVEEYRISARDYEGTFSAGGHEKEISARTYLEKYIPDAVIVEDSVHEFVYPIQIHSQKSNHYSFENAMAHPLYWKRNENDSFLIGATVYFNNKQIFDIPTTEMLSYMTPVNVVTQTRHAGNSVNRSNGIA